MTPGQRRRYRLTPEAANDIRTLLRTTATRFGALQRRNAAALIEWAAMLAGQTPDTSASRDRMELGPGVRSLHLDSVAGRRGATAHLLYYVAAPDGAGVIILRVLPHRMDKRAHLHDEGV